MLTIRLSRIGKKNKPMYRLVISEKARDTKGRALEILGSYNPYTKELKCKNDRIEYWLKVGSGMSPTVNNLLIEKGIIKGKKVKATKIKKKTAEEMKAKEEVKPEAKVEEKKDKEKKESEPKAEDKPKVETNPEAKTEKKPAEPKEEPEAEEKK